MKHQRLTDTSEAKAKKRISWTEEEKKLLLELVDEASSSGGPIPWIEIVEPFPARINEGVAARHRPMVKRTSLPKKVMKRYTAEGDERLLELAKACMSFKHMPEYFEEGPDVERLEARGLRPET